MLPVVTTVSQTSNQPSVNRVGRSGTDFFKAASNYIPPVAESSSSQKNENKTSSQRSLVASSTSFLAQLIGQNDNSGLNSALGDISLVKYMPSFASYPSNNNEQLELFPEETSSSFEEAVSSAVASGAYTQAEETSAPQPANKVTSII